jgi:hypothetical protein
MLQRAILLVAGFLALVLSAGTIQAEWIQDGVAVNTYSYSTPQAQMIADGAGGTIIVWRDSRGANDDIYSQRIDGYGRVLWTAEGAVVCNATGNQTFPNLVSDGAGGAIITWEDARGGTGRAYAQRINASGVPQWTSNGIALTNSTLTQSYPVIAPDGSGGAIIAWQDYRSGSNWDVYAQRISSSGVLQWAAAGLAVCTATGNQTTVMIVPDLAQLPYWGGGAIITWTDTRSGNEDIYVQCINAQGALVLPTSGLDICTAANSQNFPRIIPDGDGGAIIAWQDYRSGTTWDIYAQRFKPSAGLMWTANGVGVCTLAGGQVDPHLVSDGLGGAVICFYGYPTGTNTDVYAQRIDAYGNALWVSGGITVCGAAGDQGFAVSVPDGEGGAIIMWHDYRTGSANIYAQKVRSTGTVAWTAGGVEISGALYEQQYPIIASDDAGGAIAAWRDLRNDPYYSSDFELFAQRVDRLGFWGYSAPSIRSVKDVRGDQGGWVNVSWKASRLDPWPEQEITWYTIWRALTPEALAAMRASQSVRIVNAPDTASQSDKPVVRVERASGRTFYWELVSTVDAKFLSSYAKAVPTLFDSTSTSRGYHYFQVVAHRASDFWISLPDSARSVDNLAPLVPGGLAGERIWAPEGLNLTWRQNGETDLASYAIYRGTSPDFTPSPADLVASPGDTAWFDTEWRWDSGYCYKVSALDIHGNESGYALLTRDGLAGDETPKAPLVTYLSQNFPNPFNPMTKIEFGLASPDQVGLRIYDAAGRLVRVLVDGVLPASRYEKIWDGRDGMGRGVASGVYFYRLDAGTFTQTRKMILLR